MIIPILLGEFRHEAENTRKLLNAVPDSALEYRPQPHLWSTAQLASHIAEIYNWYDGVINQAEFDMGAYRYDKGDISIASNIVSKFEENVKNAQHILENASEERMSDIWRMTVGGQDIFPQTPRSAVIRGFLFNHLYHHRGELVIHLRAGGHTVPGLYGPTFEQRRR